MDDQLTSGRTPYMSFQTFWNFITELSKKPLPPQIDRSLMDSKSGTDQANLTAALKEFGLIREDLTVTPVLVALVDADEQVRLGVLQDIVASYYPKPMQVSTDQGTEKMLHDAFREAYGLDAAETRRKSVTFFLHAARTAGISLSENFPQTRSSSGGTGAKPRKPTAKKPRQSPAPPVADRPPVTPTGETRVVDFGAAGTVTITVNVKWLDLPTDSMVSLRQLVDQLDQLGATTTPADTGDNP